MSNSSNIVFCVYTVHSSGISHRTWKSIFVFSYNSLDAVNATRWFRMVINENVCMASRRIILGFSPQILSLFARWKLFLLCRFVYTCLQLGVLRYYFFPSSFPRMARIYTLWGGISEVWSLCASWGLWKWIFHGPPDKEASRNPVVLSSWWCDQLSDRNIKVLLFSTSWVGLWSDSWVQGQSTSSPADVVELQPPLGLAIWSMVRDEESWRTIHCHSWLF